MVDVLHAPLHTHNGCPPMIHITPAVIVCMCGLAQVLLFHDPEMARLPDMSGNTPAHMAVEAGNIKILKLLLPLQPNLDLQNLNISEYTQGNWVSGSEPIEPLDKTPLHIAAEAGDVQAAQLLLQAGGCWVGGQIRNPLSMHMSATTVQCLS